MKKQLPIILILMITLGSSISGQQKCSDVLLLASRNVSNQTTKSHVAKQVYDYLKTNDKSTFDADLGLAKLGLTAGLTMEEMKDMEKHYDSKYKSIYESSQSSSTVVIDAIQAWRDCIKFANVGWEMEARETGEKFVVGFRNIKRANMDINGVVYNKDDCKCTAVLDDGLREEVNGDTKFTLDTEDWWSIICDRINTGDEANENFEEVNFIVTTTRGNFTLTLPAKSKPRHDWLMDLENTIESLETTIQNNLSEINNLKSEIETSNKKIQAKNIYVNTLNATKSWTWKKQSNGSRQYSKSIKFPAGTFTKTPRIICSISMLDVDKDINTRVHVWPTKVTKDGFVLNFRDWGGTKIYSVTASYVAHTN